MKIGQSKSVDNSSKINQSPFSIKEQEDESYQEQFDAGKNRAFIKSSSFDPPSLLQRKLDAAHNSPSEGLDKETKPGLENFLGYSFNSIKVHNNPDAHEAAELIHANAYTIGNHIFLGNDANYMSPIQRKSLLAHEVVHTIQQKSFSSSTLQAKSIIDSPQSPYEKEANIIAHNFVQQQPETYHSNGLAMRRYNRIGSVSSPLIQRDIKGSQELTNGKMELNFKKNDAPEADAFAEERGTVTFTPNERAPDSNSIRLIQIVRSIDVEGATTGTPNTPVNYENVDAGREADKNKVMTTRNTSKGIEGGFHVDYPASAVRPRTSKSDAAVVPYYRRYAPNQAYSHDGYKKSKTDIRSASLFDGPGSPTAIKFSFVTSAKGADPGTNIWYGSALWGFEIYLDKDKAKIKNEYKSFRDERGATTDAALDKFNTFYRNEGTAGAPTE